MSSVPQRFLMIYSGVLTLAFSAVVLAGNESTRSTRFDTIEVHRVNVRETDGTLRMVVSGRDRFPGASAQGERSAQEQETAGVLFMDDEGDGSGGLVRRARSNGGSTLDLSDANGNPRLRLKVTPEGAASIDFLDDEGNVQRTLTPEMVAG